MFPLEFQDANKLTYLELEFWTYTYSSLLTALMPTNMDILAFATDVNATVWA